MSFDRDGRLAYSSMALAAKGALVAVLDDRGQEVALLSELVSEEMRVPETFVEELHQRKLPGFMRNQALPLFTQEGDVWVFLQTEGILQRFGVDGSLLAQAQLTIPEMRMIEEAFFDWYATVDARDLLRFFEYVDDAVIMDGSLWLLWNMPRDQAVLITIHGDDGTIVSRIIVRGIERKSPENRQAPPRRQFAIDRNRSRIYLVDREEMSVMWVSYSSINLP
ncbi:MAG: hypothetical protein ACE5HV_01285 [Acidobacteriota bacterium]